MSCANGRRRPLGVTLLGCLFAFGTFATGLSAVALLTPGGPLEPIWRLNPRGHELFGRMGAWAPIALGVVCAACGLAAFGFFTGRRWGYRLGVGVLAVDLLGDVVNWATGFEPKAFVGVPIVALLLWYLSRPKVRAFFVARPPLSPS